MPQDPSQSIVIPDKPATLVNSSSILGYSYNPSSYELFVWYHSKNGKQSIYRYLLVYPSQMSGIFDNGPGIGLKARNSLKSNPKMKVR